MPKIFRKSVIAQTRLFKIEELDIKFSNNEQRTYETISGTGEGAVMIIPVLGNNLVLISEYAAAVDDYSITFPKGKIDKGETILEAANRELQEEIGYMSSNLEHVHTLDLAPGYIDHKTHIVIARDLQKSSLRGDEPEPLKIIQHSIDEIKKSYCLTNYSHVDSRVYSSLYIFFNSQNNK